MANMSFKSFIWPENPSTYQVACKREAIYGPDENGTYIFLGLGPMVRSVSGKGSFTGETALESFQALEALCLAGSSGVLTQPEGESLTAFLTELTMELDGRPQYVAYRFTFREADENGALPE